MGLFSGVLLLPLAPVRGVIWLGEQLEREAERQMSDPAAIREQIAAVDAAYRGGTITAEERDAAQNALVGRLLRGAGSRA